MAIRPSATAITPARAQLRPVFSVRAGRAARSAGFTVATSWAAETNAVPRSRAEDAKERAVLLSVFFSASLRSRRDENSSLPNSAKV